MARKIRVISKRVGEPFRSVWISNSLKAMQGMVGGYIEMAPLDTAERIVAICDEEGRIKNKAYNITICGIDFYGDIFVCGVSGEEFCSVPFDFNERFNKLNPIYEPPRGWFGGLF